MIDDPGSLDGRVEFRGPPAARSALLDGTLRACAVFAQRFICATARLAPASARLRLFATRTPARASRT